ncbi:hypothetical protein KBY17_27100 [Streptomyces sp. RK75]|nr:hypothetical protein [Streptomyces sp. RK75]
MLALQEVGAGPPAPPSHDAGRRVEHNIGPRSHNQPDTVTQTRWQVGRQGVYRNVYYLQTDPRRVEGTDVDQWTGGRVNLATVTDTEADEVRVLENPDYDPSPGSGTRYRARPLLGLRFGDTWYWNTHARGHDVQGLLRQVREFAARDTDHPNWVLVGDFNLDILNRDNDEARNESLHLRDDETLLRTGQPTYINGTRLSELDYAVTRGLPGGFAATRPEGSGADHAPVQFNQQAPQPQPAVPSYSHSVHLATPTGTVLRENQNGSFGLGAPSQDDNQRYRMFTTGGYAHYLRGASGNCPALAPDVRRDESSRIVAGNCDDPRAQWSLTDPDEDVWWHDDNGGPQQWRNVAVPQLCLTRSDNQVAAAPCADDADQHWWNNAASMPESWSTVDKNIRLQSSWFDGRLRRIGNIPGTETVTAQKPPKRWWIYWLLVERRDYGWNLEQVSPRGNLVRIKSLDGTNQCLAADDVHATKRTIAQLRTCDDDRGVDAAGQRWLAEAYPDGTIRYRNEANHLCLAGPDGKSGNVTLYECEDAPIQRWKVVEP